LSFDSNEINKINYHIKLIQQDLPIFKRNIRSSYFNNAIPVTIGFSIKKGKYLPKYIAYKTYRTHYINFESSDNPDEVVLQEKHIKEFKHLLNSRIVAYGLDAIWLIEFIGKRNPKSKNLINLSDFIIENVHAPFWGLELSEMNLLYNLKGRISVMDKGLKRVYLTAKKRLDILCELIEYLKLNME